jgi:hypothetical protein
MLPGNIKGSGGVDEVHEYENQRHSAIDGDFTTDNGNRDS